MCFLGGPMNFGDPSAKLYYYQGFSHYYSRSSKSNLANFVPQWLQWTKSKLTLFTSPKINFLITRNRCHICLDHHSHHILTLLKSCCRHWREKFATATHRQYRFLILPLFAARIPCKHTQTVFIYYGQTASCFYHKCVF